MESPGAHVHARRATGTELLRLGAAGAATALLLSTSGDAYIVVVLLGIAAFQVGSLALAGTAFTAMLLRWGSSSLAAIAGAQAVLGPAIAVGPVFGAASSAATGVVLIAAAAPGLSAVPFGLAAAVVTAGPAATTPSCLVIRVVAAVVGAGAAYLVADRVPSLHRRRVGAAAAIVAVATAIVS